jgi:hypothetical protein
MIILIPLLGLIVTIGLLMPNEAWFAVRDFVLTNQNLQLNTDLTTMDGLLVRLGFLAIAVVIDFILLFLFLLEIRRAPQHMIRVRRAVGGEVRLPVDSIAERLAYHIDLLPGVIDVRPRVGAKGGGVTVHLFVRTAPDVDVPTKADEIITEAQSVVRDKLGLTLASEPKVELRVAPYPQTGKVQPVAIKTNSDRPSSAI